ncbi:MAG: hypothetical protein RBU21_02055 [FCB group bacterium]|jgi:hypothetical protein|nr:hypothetical protein [FCB group bacterium]
MQAWKTHCLPDFGFQIDLPSDWTVQDTGFVMANRERVDMGSPALQRRFQQATVPILACTRYPDGYDDVNPTVQTTFRPMPQLGVPATLVLEKMTGLMGQMFEDFRFIEEPVETELGGLPAARARISYAMFNSDERRFDVLARSWIVPCGKMMFIIGMSGTTQGDNVCEDEFNGMAASIRIAPDAIQA